MRSFHIFSFSLWFIFSFSCSIFQRAYIFILMKFGLLLFSLLNHAVSLHIKSYLKTQDYTKFLLCYLPEILSLDSVVRPVIRFELISLKGIISVSSYIFMHGNVLLFYHHLLEKLPLLHHFSLFFYERYFTIIMWMSIQF